MIEDLRKIKDEGVDVADGYSSETFKLHAMLFCIIKYFLSYGNLSRYSFKGHKSCHTCVEDMCYHQLRHGRLIVYLGNLRFLKHNHSYRRLKKRLFHECQENEFTLNSLTGEEFYQVVMDIKVVLNKKKKQSMEKIMCN